MRMYESLRRCCWCSEEAADHSLAIDVDVLPARQAKLVLWALQLKSEQADVVTQLSLLYQSELLLLPGVEGDGRAFLLFLDLLWLSICCRSWCLCISRYCNKKLRSDQQRLNAGTTKFPSENYFQGDQVVQI